MTNPIEAKTVVSGPPDEAKNTSFAESATIAAINRLRSMPPCRENSVAITHLETALLWLQKARFDEITAALMAKTEQRAALWTLLDNIDTLDDACRENDAEFRKRARVYLKRRFDIWRPDALED